MKKKKIHKENWKVKYIKEKFEFGHKEISERMLLKKAPSKLCQYVSIDDNYKENIKKGQIWLSRSDGFNDPYDCALFANIEKSIENDKDYKNLIQQYDTSIINDVYNDLKEKSENELDDYSKSKINKNIYVSCLSERNDSILMWSHYANKHRGICIEYNFKDFYDKCKTIFPVIYTNRFEDHITVVGQENKSILFAITKAEDWRYEKEWRVIRINELDKHEKGISMQVIKPSAIYMGCEISKKDEASIKDIVIEKNIDLYKMKLSRNSFELDPERIES
ncbi:DUF2971 domain-containing protein [Clostridium botulinum]|uniref:DUF2971 domain-containing protein n=1 Tax=Clostridium botulinum TaxID=1491 RepID=UPI000A16CC58|nr:DUF2971 domain-containing protein [Clostridium botulinum]MBY6900205.1 DUF2971 domain-containing protein [Clostridium botulinum]MBY6914318.1 DUF2971 domain-containing protein [Clostridium botulinum]OSA69883.1 hypothetical protein B2H90_00810 [Clostridium botulinum]